MKSKSAKLVTLNQINHMHNADAESMSATTLIAAELGSTTCSCCLACLGFLLGLRRISSCQLIRKVNKAIISSWPFQDVSSFERLGISEHRHKHFHLTNVHPHP